MGTNAQPVSPVLLQVRIQPSTAQRVAQAARRIDQPMAGWVRIAIMEKLERDGG